MRRMDEVASDLDETVIMQIGHTDYQPTRAEFFRFVQTDEEIQQLMKRARLVVSHAGVGTILRALRVCRPIIVVPRSAALKEHVDDHQMEIAKAFSGLGLVTSVEDPRLLTAGFLVGDFPARKKVLGPSVGDFISTWLDGKIPSKGEAGIAHL